MTGAPTGTGLDRDDLAVVACGVVAFASAWLPWYETRDGVLSLRGWALGFTATVAVLLSVYAAGRVALLRRFPPKPDVPVTPQAETFLAAVLGLLLLAYRIVDAPTVAGVPAVRTFGIVVAGLVLLVQVVCAGRKLGRTGVRAR
ncbi:MAG TPA: hypothetical protein VF519_02840 [Mycobacteriales bacterium]